MMDAPKQFVCAMCGGTFDEEWSEEVALQELRTYFGDVPKEECDTVCDDCWAKIHPNRN